jgi:predicted transcriptional regulator
LINNAGRRIANLCGLRGHVLADEISREESVEREILRYLLAHPAAADSAAGVRIWWLRDPGEISEAMVRGVLERLLKRGWLITRGDTPETRIYALNEQAKDAVASSAGEPGDRPNG